MGKIVAVCISEKKGTAKKPISSARLIEDFGIENDSHAGKWHRQISLLNKEAIEDFNKKGAGVTYGDFGENIVVEGLNLNQLKVGDLLSVNDVILEISQLGKECHDHCEIYKRVGQCIMPVLGVFAVVKQGGIIKPSDEIKEIERQTPYPFQAAVITLSDSCFKKQKEDLSGPFLIKSLKDNGYVVCEEILLPDDKALLKRNLIRLCDQRQLDLIITTGGTGLSSRDITPEVTMEIMDKNVPGISEALRASSLKFTKNAMISRGASVIRKKTLIINFPGSLKACEESFDIVKDVLGHAIGLLRGSVRDCARINKL